MGVNRTTFVSINDSDWLGQGYYNDLYSQVTSTTPLSAPPVGTVTAWLKSYTNTPALPSTWLECNGQVVSDAGSPYNGQTLPNLNSGTYKSLIGSTASGTTTANDYGFDKGGPNQKIIGVSGNTWAANPGALASGQQNTVSVSGLPQTYSVVWIIKIK